MPREKSDFCAVPSVPLLSIVTPFSYFLYCCFCIWGLTFWEKTSTPGAGDGQWLRNVSFIGKLTSPEPMLVTPSSFAEPPPLCLHGPRWLGTASVPWACWSYSGWPTPSSFAPPCLFYEDSSKDSCSCFPSLSAALTCSGAFPMWFYIGHIEWGLSSGLVHWAFHIEY